MNGPLHSARRTCADARLPADLSVVEILHSMADGVYITDVERRIVFWNRSAERITGWSAADVMGKTCSDNILVHVDKDGRQLCGEEFCPLHRAMITDQAGADPLLVYARHKDGQRIPVGVSVAPIHDAEGAVRGGIEVFRDLSAMETDLRCARAIQQHALATTLPDDPRYQFSIRYLPRDDVGGDFYRLERLGDDTYAGMVADVMGHGVSAALYTMQLRALWDDHRAAMNDPSAFLGQINRRLHSLAHEEGYFATGFFFLLDAPTGQLCYANAGHPEPILVRRDGQADFLSGGGPGLGLFPEGDYPRQETRLDPGDTLVVFTDGATELFNKTGDELQESGLVKALRHANVGADSFQFDALEESLLLFSNAIRFPDDLTLLRIRRGDTH